MTSASTHSRQMPSRPAFSVAQVDTLRADAENAQITNQDLPYPALVRTMTIIRGVFLEVNTVIRCDSAL